MAFDINNTAHRTAAKSEYDSDPIGMGYAAASNTNQILDLFNNPELNVGAETDPTEFTAESMMDALVPTEFEAPQTNAGAAQYTHILMEMANGRSIEPFKAKWRSMFGGNSATVTALDAQNRRLSRLEVLFGNGSFMTRSDWATILETTP